MFYERDLAALEGERRLCRGGQMLPFLPRRERGETTETEVKRDVEIAVAIRQRVRPRLAARTMGEGLTPPDALA